MLTVTLYTREGCHLCQKAEDELRSLQSEIPHKLVLIDVDEENLKEYIEKIPVVEVGPYQVNAPFDLKTLEMTLAAAQDRVNQLEKINQEAYQKKIERGKRITFGDRLFNWLSRRYMVVFNGFVAIYLGLAVIAPVLFANGQFNSSNLIYAVYGRMCHQLSYRSWFIFGEQAVYPREIAGLDDLESYEEATGFDPFDIETAFKFIGNERMGYKMALCQRDIAMYGGILLFGLLFSITGRRIPSLPIWAWFILGILPVGLDGITQLISQLPWDFVPMRESTPFLRTLTGGLFGFSTAWFGYPIVEEAMADTRKLITVKIKASETDTSDL
jgi:uncharacterized membrane protein/glutaredoxin